MHHLVVVIVELHKSVTILLLTAVRSVINDDTRDFIFLSQLENLDTPIRNRIEPININKQQTGIMSRVSSAMNNSVEGTTTPKAMPAIDNPLLGF